MSFESIAEQFFNVVPPADTKIVCLATSATAASDDLTARNLMGAYDAAKKVDYVEVTIIAEGCDCYISTSDAAVTINPATTGQATTIPFLLPQGLPHSFRINKLLDKTLNYVAPAGKTGFLRFYASSNRSEQGVARQ